MEYASYILYIVVLLAVGILYDKYKLHNTQEEDIKQYDLVKKYLLNESSLARSHLPLIWIHASKEVNARWWASFYSRNTTCVNQPYELITIKSVIDRCGESFNICLIDDSTFRKLMPDWNTDLERLAEPVKSKVRELAFARLLHTYGGFRVPASFLCMENLDSIYQDTVKDGGVLVGELLNRGVSSEDHTFMTNPAFLACERDCPIIAQYIDYLQRLISEDYTAESIFKGSIAEWFIVQQGINITVLSAKSLGMVDTKGELVTIERLAENTFVSLCPEAYGIYFPANEILNRTAYQWLARLSVGQMLSSDTTMGKVLLVSSR